MGVRAALSFFVVLLLAADLSSALPRPGASDDGVQDFGEIGLAGVDLDLLGAGGARIGDVSTGGGLYSFEVEAGSYSVDMPAGNFGAGGALQGMVTTIANTLDTTVVDDNDLPIDFGYRHVAPPGTGTQGCWKNHPEAWPVAALEIGGVLYQQEELLKLMDQPTRGVVTLLMLAQVVAARLNVASGTDSSCVSGELEAADDWLARYPPGSGVRANSAAWRNGGEALKDHLDAYNNGELCAPHRG